LLLSQHSSRWRWKAEGSQKQVEALENSGKYRPKRSLQAPTPPNLENVALRFDLLSSECGLTLAHLCRQLLWSARLKTERSKSPTLEGATLVGSLSRCDNISLVIRLSRRITQVIDQSDVKADA